MQKKNHSQCNCTFVKEVKVTTDSLLGNGVYPAQIWKTPGGISYCRIFSDEKNYFRVDMTEVKIVSDENE